MKFTFIKNNNSTNISAVCHDASCEDELDIQSAIRGYEQEMELDDIKKVAEIGDRILVRFDGKLSPWIIIGKDEDNNLIINSEDCLERSKFDDKTNVWKDSYLRGYINSDKFMKKFDPEFIKLTKPTDVHTENYVTTDRFWVPSHEEVNCDSKAAEWFNKNNNTKRYEYFTDKESRIKNYYNED